MKDARLIALGTEFLCTHRARKFATLPKCLIIHSLCNHLHTTKPFPSPLKMLKILLSVL